MRLPPPTQAYFDPDCAEVNQGVGGSFANRHSINDAPSLMHPSYECITIESRLWTFLLLEHILLLVVRFTVQHLDSVPESVRDQVFEMDHSFKVKLADMTRLGRSGSRGSMDEEGGQREDSPAPLQSPTTVRKRAGRRVSIMGRIQIE